MIWKRAMSFWDFAIWIPICALAGWFGAGWVTAFILHFK